MFYDQFKHLVAQGLYTSNVREQIIYKELMPIDQWHWTSVERPRIHYVELSATQTLSKKHYSENALWLLSKELQSKGRTADLLNIIRDTWAHSEIPARYVDKALVDCEAWLHHTDHIDSKTVFLTVLFELEAYAAFLSATSSFEMIGGGTFAGNWIEVGTLPISAFRPTELCQNQRLLQELINLVDRGFAPIVVNEKLCVADGNHRLTASWLWNLLCSTSHLRWHLDDARFQMEVANFANKSIAQPVVIHEVLHHLATFLDEPSTRRLLELRLRPFISPARQLDELFATILPEYLSGAVVKSEYDKGTDVRRAEPMLYEIMSTTSNTVLPARASYHFTDRALLPWFSVLDGGAISLRKEQP